MTCLQFASARGKRPRRSRRDLVHCDLPPALLVKTLNALEQARAPLPAPRQRQCETYAAPVDTHVLDALAPLVVEEIVVRLLRCEAAGALGDLAIVARAAGRIQKSMQFIQAHMPRPGRAGGEEPVPLRA